MTSASFNDAKLILNKLAYSALGAARFAANQAVPAVAAAFDYAKPAVKATCSTIAETVTNAPELAAGVTGIAATAFIGYNLMPKRRKISYRNDSVEPNSSDFVGQFSISN